MAAAAAAEEEGGGHLLGTASGGCQLPLHERHRGRLVGVMISTRQQAEQAEKGQQQQQLADRAQSSSRSRMNHGIILCNTFA